MVERTSRVIEEGQRGGAEREVDKVAGHAVGKSLHGARERSARLHGLDDLAVARVATDALGADLERAGLVDRAGEDRRARGLLDRHRLAGDAGLVNEGVAADHRAVDRHAPAGLTSTASPTSKLVDIDFEHAAGVGGRTPIAAESRRRSRIACRPRETVMPSSTSATSTKSVMTSAVKNSPMRGSRNDGDGHGELHRHAPLEQVLERLLEDRPAADEQAERHRSG